jgi:DNA-binding SARP family transcriptional activator
VIDVDSDSTGRELQITTARLAEAVTEYERLRASIASLGAHLAAMQNIYERPEPFGVPQPAAYEQELRVLRGEDKESTSPVPVLVNLLGPFQIEMPGRSYGPGVPGQVRTVLEFLISQGRRPTPKDALLDLLWPETDPETAASRLRVVMHTLRKTIPSTGYDFGDLVVMSGNNFMLNPQAPMWVDVEEFERHWLSGWRLARAGRSVEALHEYEEAEALYRGDYLEDEPYADWTLLRREALRDAYASILSMLATMSLNARDYIGCIIWAQKLLAQDNCREDAYRLLMTSHTRLGQTSRAAYWYNLCAWSLKRELGIEPSIETRELYEGMQ